MINIKYQKLSTIGGKIFRTRLDDWAEILGVSDLSLLCLVEGLVVGLLGLNCGYETESEGSVIMKVCGWEGR